MRLYLTAILVALAVMLGGCGKNKFQQEVEKEQGAVKLLRETQEGGYGILTAEELKKLLDGKADMLVVDTMPFEDSYKKAHIPGAKQFLFPIPTMEQWNAEDCGGKTLDQYDHFLGEDKNRLIVVYCGFVKCTRSHNGAAWAVKLGYRNVKRFPGGIFAWKGAGYPAEAGE